MYPQFIDDPGLMNDEKLKPITLPLSHLSSLMTTTTGERSDPRLLPQLHGIPPPCGIYADAVGRVSAGTESPRPSRGTWSKAEPPKPAQPSLVELLQDLKLSERQELFFMQLPDCMPGRVAAQGTDSLLGSPAADMRPGHFHGQVSNSNLCMFITLLLTEYKNSRTEECGALHFLVLISNLLKHHCV